MIDDRLALARELLSRRRCALHHDRRHRAVTSLASCSIRMLLADDHQLGTVGNRSNPSGRSTDSGLSRVVTSTHLFYGIRDASSRTTAAQRETAETARSKIDGEHVDWRNFRKDGGAESHTARAAEAVLPNLRIARCDRFRYASSEWSSLARDQADAEIAVRRIAWPIGRSDDEGSGELALSEST